jgi:acetyl esterase/lipase
LKGSRRALVLLAPAGLLARPALATTPAPTVRRDIAYGPLPRQRVDLYLPWSAAPDAAVLTFLHGGTWRSGSKDLYGALGLAFAQRGLPICIPNYRLFPEIRFPTFVQDAALAQAWLDGVPGLPRGPRVIIGHSAGAHIAMLLALDPRWLQAARAPGPAGAVGLAGPYDFMPLPAGNFLADIFGGTNVPDSQPISFAQRPGPAILLLHGTADRVAPPDQSERLAARRRAAGQPVQHVTFPGVGHVEILHGLGGEAAPVMAPILRFLASLGAGGR